MDYNNEPPKIVFEGQEFQQSARSFQTPTPKIVEWVIKYSSGLVKDKKQANYVLIGFVVLMIIISLFTMFSGESSKSEKPGIETFKNAPSEMIPLQNNQ